VFTALGFSLFILLTASKLKLRIRRVLQYKLKEKKSKTATFTFAYSLAFFIIFISFWPRRTNCTAQRKVDELAKLAINFVEE